jgi:nuclear protein localization family protein 4
MIYLISTQENLFTKENIPPLIIKSDNPSSTLDFLSNLIDPKEDEVDLQLDKIDGRISREPNPQLYDKIYIFFHFDFIEIFRCHHNKHGKCLHCIPIEPYDEEYLKAHNPPIKHLSFQAYIRKLQSLTPGERYESLIQIDFLLTVLK